MTSVTDDSPPLGEGNFTCGCGRSFDSSLAWDQHWRDMADKSANEACGPPPPPEILPKIKPKDESWMLRGTVGDELYTTDSASIEPADVTVTSTAGCDVLCTYNSSLARQPTIYVPGEIPRWSPAELPMTLKGGSAGRDGTGDVGLPRFPFEMAFRAMEAMNPTARLDDVDVLSNRSSLRKLLKFCSGTSHQSFRLDLQALANTLVVEKRERTARHLLHHTFANAGFGHRFERAVSKHPPGMDRTASHRRVLTYDLGGLRCAVNVEVDAWVPESHAEQSIGVLPTANSITTARRNMQFCAAAAKRPTRLIKRGKFVPQSLTAEIKTTSAVDKSGMIGRWMPQLWLGRTPWLIKGDHQEGTFHNINVFNAGEKFVEWETREHNQDALRKMTTLLAKLRDIVQATPLKTAIAVFQHQRLKPTKLMIFATTHRRRPLPHDLISKFWGRGKSTAKNAPD